MQAVTDLRAALGLWRGELEQLAVAEPLDEQLHAQLMLMLALYRAGRQADAQWCW